MPFALVFSGVHTEAITVNHDSFKVSRKSHHRTHIAHKRPHARLGTHYTVSSTCYAQGSITASGGPVYLGEVANNFLALGSRIMLDHPVFGRREYRVEDRIGSGSELDIYNPSETVCDNYGREEIGFRLIE